MKKFFKGIKRFCFGKSVEETVRVNAALNEMASRIFNGGNPLNYERKKDTPESLKALFDGYTNTETFAPGDMVMWKKGLKNKTRPAYGDPAVVIALDPGVISTGTSDNQYFRENISLCIGITDGDNDLVIFHVDPARFTRYIAPTTPSTPDGAGTLAE